jgi:hypothetical protein
MVRGTSVHYNTEADTSTLLSGINKIAAKPNLRGLRSLRRPGAPS